LPPKNPPSSIGGILRHLAAHPLETLLRRWNWKSAVLSSIFRANLFLAANLTAGLKRAVAAALAEFLFRFALSGFYGGLTQALGRAEPAWTGLMAALLVVPAISHSMEFLIHWLRGTPHLRTSIIASVCFTGISTAFHCFAMRRGALITGEGRTLRSDMARMPRLLVEFFVEGWRAATDAAGWFALQAGLRRS
jgi:hypothetical protein